jgi:AmmeMemoRadiSam system protein B
MQEGMVKPKLRPIDVRPTVDRGRPVLLLRDPLGISDKVVVVPQALGPLLALCDGSRTLPELHAGFLVRTGLQITPDLVQKVMDQLDGALLLESDGFDDAYAEALDDYRTAPFRLPGLAGAGYPAEPAELRQMLDDQLAAAAGNQSGAEAPSENGQVNGAQAGISGLVSPHIDFQRGGPVYAQVWGQAAEAVRAADLAVIFGTDHSVDTSLITLTRQHYATPYGTLPTATPVVDAIAAAIGEEKAFAEEIHHRGEHSIELAAVWLHHVRGGQPCELVPILCGSFQHFIEGGDDPAVDPILSRALDALRRATMGRRVIVVAAADLAHVGPAFNDPLLVDYVRYLRLQAADEILIDTITHSDADAFFRTIATEGNRRNVCGLSPIYLALNLLDGQVTGEVAGYDRCPADGQNTSFVSICGVVFRDQNEGRSDGGSAANQR